MKFLIFNAAVIAALAYLFTGGELSVAPILDKARDLVSEAAVKAAPLPVANTASDFTPKSTVEVVPVVEAPKSVPRNIGHRADKTPKPTVEPERESSPVPTMIAKAPKGPSPVSIPAGTPKPAPFISDDKDGLPLIDVEREVARVVPKMVPIPASAPVTATAPTPQFMSPSERRRELSKLARAMENMFLRHSASD
jgi:hypothetical protein